jgi:hypothetical protein
LFLINFNFHSSFFAHLLPAYPLEFRISIRSGLLRDFSALSTEHSFLAKRQEHRHLHTQSSMCMCLLFCEHNFPVFLLLWVNSDTQSSKI